jgi:hypothetical protein
VPRPEGAREPRRLDADCGRQLAEPDALAGAGAQELLGGAQPDGIAPFRPRLAARRREQLEREALGRERGGGVGCMELAGEPRGEPREPGRAQVGDPVEAAAARLRGVSELDDRHGRAPRAELCAVRGAHRHRHPAAALEPERPAPERLLQRPVEDEREVGLLRLELGLGVPGRKAELRDREAVHVRGGDADSVDRLDLRETGAHVSRTGARRGS